MKIAMVITSYHPIVGGAEKQAAQLAGLMLTAGHSVSIITRRWPGLVAKEAIDGICVYRVGGAGPKPLAAASFLAGTVALLQRLAPDVIHCHSLFSPTIAGTFGKMFTSVPLIAKPMCGGEAASVRAKRMGGLRFGWTARAVDCFVAVSSEIEHELVGLGVSPAKTRRIPNGVDPHRFRPARDLPERQALRASLDLPNGPLFLFAGRIATQKRLPQLLEHWPRVLAAVPGAFLLVAGANRNSSGMTKADGADDTVPDLLLHQPGVRMLGHVAEMAPLYRAVDVFVLPSMREGLSNAMLEACASGLPTIAAAIGGAEDLITSGETGVLFHKDRMDQMADAMIDLGRSQEKRSRIGAAARGAVLTTCDINDTAHRLLDLYHEMSGAKRPAGSRNSHRVLD